MSTKEQEPVLTVSNDYDTHLCFSMIKCLRARRGNVHRKQNCFRGVLLFKTHFAEFCVKYVCKTMPWNWAVRPLLVDRYFDRYLEHDTQLVDRYFDRSPFSVT